MGFEIDGSSGAGPEYFFESEVETQKVIESLLWRQLSHTLRTDITNRGTIFINIPTWN